MTREDVLREFAGANDANVFDGFRTFDMADEIVTLRAQLAGVRERVEMLDRYDVDYCDGESGSCFAGMHMDATGDYLEIRDVLAALDGAQ